MATGVPGKVHGADGDTAEVDRLAVDEPDGIGSWHVTEVAHNDLAERSLGCRRHPVDLHQAVERPRSLQVELVDVYGRLGEQVHPGEVVLVSVGQHDMVDRW